MLNNVNQKTIDAMYPIGALYLSMNNTNPELLFGGEWKQLTADAYLKIVTSDAGETAKGNTDHKITIKEMPSHTHVQNKHHHNLLSNNYGNANANGFGNGSGVRGVSGVWTNGGQTNRYYEKDNNNSENQLVSDTTPTNQNTGGGQAYYPGYIGIYVWYRTA